VPSAVPSGGLLQGTSPNAIERAMPRAKSIWPDRPRSAIDSGPRSGWPSSATGIRAPGRASERGRIARATPTKVAGGVASLTRAEVTDPDGAAAPVSPGARSADGAAGAADAVARAGGAAAAIGVLSTPLSDGSADGERGAHRDGAVGRTEVVLKGVLTWGRALRNQEAAAPARRRHGAISRVVGARGKVRRPPGDLAAAGALSSARVELDRVGG
jgi:hypothetical protein